MSKVECSNCHHKSSQEEHFHHISLGAAESLQSFFDGGNVADYRCEQCQMVGVTSKEVRLQVAPTIAILQFKIFEKEEGCRSKKIPHYGSFQTVMDLTPHSTNKTVHLKYNLYGVVVHLGETLEGGHYICFIKSMGKWHQISDQLVEETDEEVVLEQAAYILFYERDDRE
ncbi:unnamed protein product [Linum tenue]|uniref:USP domain-containing protein n=1 Tax=Linum tenue TaxID=586396 RepID=A0AAV0JZ78_9ROSI|nr:unnamed protein product [Linum tenue]